MLWIIKVHIVYGLRLLIGPLKVICILQMSKFDASQISRE